MHSCSLPNFNDIQQFAAKLLRCPSWTLLAALDLIGSGLYSFRNIQKAICWYWRTPNKPTKSCSKSLITQPEISQFRSNLAHSLTTRHLIYYTRVQGQEVKGHRKCIDASSYVMLTQLVQSLNTNKRVSLTH